MNPYSNNIDPLAGISRRVSYGPSREVSRKGEALEALIEAVASGKVRIKAIHKLLGKSAQQPYKAVTFEEIRKRVSDNVNFLIDKKKISAFAQMSRANYITTYRIRKNRTRPTLNALISICNDLEVDIGDLVGKDISKNSSKTLHKNG